MEMNDEKWYNEQADQNAKSDEQGWWQSSDASGCWPEAVMAVVAIMPMLAMMPMLAVVPPVLAVSR